MNDTLRAIAGFSILLASAVQAEIVVDGRLDEAEWQQAQRFTDFVQTQPLTAAKPPEDLGMVALLASTPEGIAVALTAKHPSTRGRNRSRIPRDGEGQMDRVNFMVDFDGQGRNGFDFTVTLANDIIDSVITNENQFNTDWDGDWQHAVLEQEDQYTVEWLIPWSTAPMQGSDTPTRTIAVFFSRVLAETGERWAFPDAIWSRPTFVSTFHPIEIPQYRASLLSVTPYAVARQDIANSDSDYKVGVDVFWKPNGDHQFAATVNPDFGQVESDQLVVNFDAIETFFTDKRPFFTENQAYFQVANPGGNLFYTRRVGGPSDDGSGAADIDAAIKANGSVGDLGYGVFAASEDGDAGRDFFLARGTHASESATLGITQTYVDRPFLDRTAAVTALDSRWRPNDEWSIQSGLMFSDVDVAGTSRTGLGGGVIADWDPAGPWRQQYFLIHVGDDLQLNDLGFQDRNNFLLAEWETGFRQDNLPADSRFASHQYEFEVVRQVDDHGLTLRETYAVQRNSELRDGGSMFAMFRYLRPAWDDLISRGHGAIRKEATPAFYIERFKPRSADGQWSWFGNFEWVNKNYGTSWFGGVEPTLHLGDAFNISTRLSMNVRDRWVLWQGDANFAAFDSKRLELSSSLNWFINEQQELRVKLEAIAIDAAGGDRLVANQNGELVSTGAIADDFGVRNLGFQVRYRYKLGTLSDLFAVYGRGGFERETGIDDGLGDLFGDSFALDQDNQFLIKLAYRFTP